MRPWIVILIIRAIVAAVVAVLYFLGKKTEKKQAEQQAQIDAMKQTMTMLVIDKKKMKIKDAGFPDVVLAQTPWYLKWRKFPVIKAKVGPRIASFLTEKDLFEIIPVKKEIKATISGLYITDVKSVRGSLEVSAKKKKKKDSKIDELIRKGRGEA